jgi:hypothetical protein
LRKTTATMLALIAALAASTAPAATAQARELLATYESAKGCPGAPTWRFGYRIYNRDTEGRTFNFAVKDSWLLRHAKSFVDDVANFSDCGVRAHMQVWEESEPWPANPGSPDNFKPGDRRFPPDAEQFRTDNRLDTVFYRVPQTGREDYAAITNYRDVELIGTPNDNYNPWAPLLFHEWLHGVHRFYGKIAQGWAPNPATDPVHAACDYRTQFKQCGLVDTEYFSALMTGQVAIGGGRHVGIRKEEWAKFGTPTSPTPLTAGRVDELTELPPPEERLSPNLRISFHRPNRVVGNFEAPGPVTLYVYSERTGRLLDHKTYDEPFEARLVAGRYTACILFAGDAEYEPAQECVQAHPVHSVDHLVELRKTGFAKAKLKARGVARDRRAAAVWTFARCTETPPSVPGVEVPTRSQMRAASCEPGRTVRRELTLAKSTKLAAPDRRPGENLVMLDVEVYEFNADGHLHAARPGSLGLYWERGGSR